MIARPILLQHRRPNLFGSIPHGGQNCSRTSPDELYHLGSTSNDVVRWMAAIGLLVTVVLASLIISTGPARANLVDVELALKAAKTRATYFSNQALKCELAKNLKFDNCKHVAAAIARLRELSKEVAQLKGSLETEKKLTDKSATQYLRSLNITQTSINKLDNALVWQDFITAIGKAVLLSGDLALIKRRWASEGKFERNWNDPTGSKPKPGLDDTEWNISDQEASMLTKAVDGIMAALALLRDEQGIYGLSTDPGNKDKISLDHWSALFDFGDLALAAKDLKQAISAHGLKEAMKRPGPRGALLLFVEKAGDYLIKWDKMKRLARRKRLVTAQDSEQAVFNDFIVRMQYIQELLDEVAQLQRDIRNSADALQGCLKKLCPGVAIPNISVPPAPTGSYIEQQRAMTKRIQAINDRLSDLANGANVTQRKQKPKPGSTPEEKAKVAQLNEQVKKLREQLKILEGQRDRAYKRVINGKSDNPDADSATIRDLRPKIKRLKQKEAQLENARDEAAGKKPKNAGVDLSMSLPGKCKAGQRCMAKAQVFNQGRDLYSVSMPVMFSVSTPLATTLHASQDLVCATAGTYVTCMTRVLDLPSGGRIEVNVPLVLARNARGPLRSCSRFPDLSGARQGNPGQDATRLLQLALSGLGMKLGAVDGKMGPATRRAMKHFAKLAGLPAGERSSGQLFDALLPFPIIAAAGGDRSWRSCADANVIALPQHSPPQRSTNNRDRQQGHQQERSVPERQQGSMVQITPPKLVIPAR